jgi:hypothetical protein
VQNHHIDHAAQNRVMAVFASSAAVFDLPPAATFEELAGRLAHLSEGHDGALISVDVRVGPRHGNNRSSLRLGAPVDRRDAPSATLLRRIRRLFLNGEAAQ